MSNPSKKNAEVLGKAGFDRLFGRTVAEAGGCWRWTGYVMPEGYGQIGVGLKVRLTHRVAFEALLGPIPDGLVLDHLCRNRWCINPTHLEPVTERTNILRGIAPMVQVHLSGVCSKGHPQTVENVYRRGPHRRGDGECRPCKREKFREWVARNPDYQTRGRKAIV